MSTQQTNTATTSEPEPLPSERLLDIFCMHIEDAIAPIDNGHAALPDFVLTRIQEELDKIQYEHHQFRPLQILWFALRFYGEHIEHGVGHDGRPLCRCEDEEPDEPQGHKELNESAS
jgi:hypothetical protein